MLIKLVDYLKPDNNLDKSYLGKVVDNLDPKKLGRVKVEIRELFEGTKDELPWVFPRNATGFGGGVSSSSFCVPEIDSQLEIIFPFKDIYFPVYVGYWQNALTHQTVFDADYPDSYGWLDSTGIKFSVNKKTGDFLFQHSSGSKVTINQAGDVLIESAAKMDIKTTGDTKIDSGGKMDIKSVGDTKVDSSGKVEIKSASEVKIDGPSKISLNGETGQVLTNVTDPVVDLLTGFPTIGVPTVLAG